MSTTAEPPLPESAAPVDTNIDSRYTDGEYVEKNPTFHVERGEFKTMHLLKMCRKHGLSPKSIADIGCGAGEVTKLMAEAFPAADPVTGYELSPQGFEMCRQRATDRLTFHNGLVDETDNHYDLVISCDVSEHVEDPWQFFRAMRPHGDHFLIHFPLDMTVVGVLLNKPIRNVRKNLGHIHYFTKDTACAVMRESGFDVIDTAYTPSGIYKRRNPKKVLAAPFRMAAKAVAPDLAVRCLGGYSMMLYARPTK